jgi:hypothetical protein
MRMQCRRSRENDRQRHQRTERHAGNRIDADPGKFRARLLRRHAKRFGVVAVFLLDFLPCLPEEQIRANGRTEDRHHGHRVCSA